jgi:hypothetical protein|tara:strand:- start:163 stop:606 length:444 start_codon:yes stop_codon:yes gene_type:complete
MILIAHRGNTAGINPERENTVAYINEALEKGYHCEIDICKWDNDLGKFYLGHDEPTEVVDREWLKDNNLWCHAKSYNALEAMMAMGIHCFFHKGDDYTLTSNGWIWAYPGMPGGVKTIAVHPEKLNPEEVKKFAGICGDNIEKYKND